jgi:hypothetical protein
LAATGELKTYLTEKKGDDIELLAAIKEFKQSSSEIPTK